MSFEKNSGRAGKGRVNVSESLKRAMRMLCILSQSSGLSASEIVARLASEGSRTTEKRVRENLRRMQDAGVGVWEDQDDRTETGASRWKVHVGVRVGKVLQLNRQELLALFLSRQSLIPLKETAIYRDFQSAFKKIDSVLGRPEVKELHNLEDEVHFTQFQGLLMQLDREVVDAAHAACSEGHVLECCYYSPVRQITDSRRLGPHFMTYSGGALYLFAEDLADKKLKTFALSRMRSARMLSDQTYAADRVSYQEAFGNDLSIFRGDGVAQKVVLHFLAGGAATYVRERIWHPSQRIESPGDGSIRLEMTVAISSWLTRWLLGFEDSVEILEPASLRDQVIAAAESVLRAYRRQKAA